MIRRLSIFALFCCILGNASQVNAQAGDSSITFSVIKLEPCRYRLFVNNTSPDCFNQATLLLQAGYYTGFMANSADGWVVEQLSPTELLLTHSNGLFPVGSTRAVDFSFYEPGGIDPVFSVLYPNLCLMEGYAVDLPLEACPGGSVSGTVYRECTGKPYTNQQEIEKWSIELTDLDGNLIASTESGPDGSYAFFDLPPDMYRIKSFVPTGWTANMPVSGQWQLQVNAATNYMRDFGNCPDCSCDSIRLSISSNLSSGLDTSCYNLKIENADNYCFSQIDIQVNQEKDIVVWSLLNTNWSANLVNAQKIELFPPDNYISVGINEPLAFCVSGEPEHEISISTIWNGPTNPNTCLKITKPDTKYGCTGSICKYTPAYPGLLDMTWSIDFYCNDYGNRIANSDYHLQSAILMPIGFPDPKIELTDVNGDPVFTPFGQPITLVFNTEASGKVQSLSPAPIGYKWYGLQSNQLTAASSGLFDSLDFKIVFCWKDLPDGSESATGSFWVSDDKDDQHTELISDGYIQLGSPTRQATTAYVVLGKNCVWSVGPPWATWEIYTLCIGDKGVSTLKSAIPFQIEIGVLIPNDLPFPSIIISDSLGNPISTANGEVITMSSNDEVNTKIDSLSPAPSGYKWLGLKSNLLTLNFPLNPDTLGFRVACQWQMPLPASSQNSTGAFWITDDLDDHYCELVSDAYTDLGAFVLSTATNSFSKSLRLYPNPNNGTFSVHLSDTPDSDMYFRVIGITGQVLSEQKLQQGQAAQTVNTKNLSAGLYFLQIVFEGRVMAIEKFVKQ